MTNLFNYAYFQSNRTKQEKRDNPLTSFKKRRCYDSTMAAIRVIVSFVTDQLHQLRNVRSKDRLSFYERMLTDIVGVTRSSLTTVQFACIFLSIARQLEHYHLEHLFPLPYQAESTLKYITVEDLFNTSVMKKTLPVASSSLPIFETTELLHDYCLDLLHHCLTSVLGFVCADDFTNLWCLREECFFLQQIFNYTVKLEDSYEAQQYHYEDSLEEQYHEESSNISNESNNDDASGLEHSYFTSEDSGESESIDSFETETSHAELKIKTETPSRIKRLASVFTPSFLRSNSNKDDERAIAEAASTFVLSGFGNEAVKNDDSTDYKDLSLSSAGSIVHDDSILLDLSVASSKGSVSVIIGKAIAFCMFTIPSKKKTKCWSGLNQITVLCTLLHGQSNDRKYELDSTLNLIQTINERTYEKVLRSLNEIYFNESKFDESMHNHNISCTSIMARLIQMCMKKWSPRDANTVYDVMISVLARYKKTSDEDYLLSILALLTIISCHVSCQTRALLSDIRMESSEIGCLFKRVLDLDRM